MENSFSEAQTTRSLSRTQRQREPFERPNEGDLVREPTSEEQLEQELRLERKRKGKVVLDSDDEPDALDDTARSLEPLRDGETRMDYDRNDKPEIHHLQLLISVCLILPNKRREEVLISFSTTQLQALVAQEHRNSLPPKPATLKEVMSRPHNKECKEDIQKEYVALLERNTWERVE